MADAILKLCPRCCESKSLADFWRQGKAGYCIPCEKAYKRQHYLANSEAIKLKSSKWSRENPERKKQADKAWRRANHQHCVAKSAAWAASNPEARKAIYTKSRQANIDSYRAREASYRERHRVLCNERIREWKLRNPHACVMYASKRRAAEIEALPAWADLDAIAAIYKKARACGLSVDHAVPLLSEVVCGLHCEANLQLLTLTENSRKNNRHWPDMWEPL